MFYYLKKIMVQFYSFWFVNEDTLEYPVTFCLFFFFFTNKYVPIVSLPFSLMLVVELNKIEQTKDKLK